MSKAKEHLKRKLTLWDQVAKDKHDHDLAVEIKNQEARHKMNKDTSQFLKSQMGFNREIQKMTKVQVNVQKDEMKKSVLQYKQDEIRKQSIDKLRKQETAKIYMQSMNVRENNI